MSTARSARSWPWVSGTPSFTVARMAPERIPARSRIPSDAVWDATVVAVNTPAFIFDEELDWLEMAGQRSEERPF
jgi:hypothetical protein